MCLFYRFKKAQTLGVPELQLAAYQGFTNIAITGEEPLPPPVAPERPESIYDVIMDDHLDSRENISLNYDEFGYLQPEYQRAPETYLDLIPSKRNSNTYLTVASPELNSEN